jgi:adenine phosphoribosyltransferase
VIAVALFAAVLCKAMPKRQIGANVVAACFIIDLPDLGGAAKLRAMDVPVRTLMSFEGH